MIVLVAVVMSVVALILFPLAVFLVANSTVDDQYFNSLFRRNDSSTYFTDSILIDLRKKYMVEYSLKIKKTVFFVISVCLVFSIYCFGEHWIITPGLQYEMIELFLAISYFFGVVFIFGGLGASEARFSATKPLRPHERRYMKKIIVESSDSDALVKFINQNPKKRLAYIDVLNLEFQSKMLQSESDKQIQREKLSGLLK